MKNKTHFRLYYTYSDKNLDEMGKKWLQFTGFT